MPYILELQITDPSLKPLYEKSLSKLSSKEYCENPHKDSGFDLYLPQDVELEGNIAILSVATSSGQSVSPSFSSSRPKIECYLFRNIVICTIDNKMIGLPAVVINKDDIDLDQIIFGLRLEIGDTPPEYIWAIHNVKLYSK